MEGSSHSYWYLPAYKVHRKASGVGLVDEIFGAAIGQAEMGAAQ